MFYQCNFGADCPKEVMLSLSGTCLDPMSTSLSLLVSFSWYSGK